MEGKIEKGGKWTSAQGTVHIAALSVALSPLRPLFLIHMQVSHGQVGVVVVVVGGVEKKK